MKQDVTPTLHELLAAERRARLAAERLLEQKQAELTRANKRLGSHAKVLSDEVITRRREVRDVRNEAENLKGQNTRAKADLERANKQAVVAERRLWDALETIQDGFAVFNASHQLIIANRAYLALWDGVEHIRPGITYSDLLQLFVEEGIVDLGQDDPDDWCDAMTRRWTSATCEPVMLKLWNGTYLRIMDHRTQDGDMVSLALDVTDSMRHEAELQDARDRAEAAARAKAAFLANMSHEIRTPMNGVVGMADLLIESRLDDEQRLYADTIKSSAEALLVIINDVLDYSKIEAEKLVLHPAPFDLERAIHEVLILLQPTATDKGLELLVDYDMFLPTRFVADPGRVRQILTNLVGNAVKFTNSGHILVRVTGYSDDDENTAYNLHITVEDTGIGISEDKVELIFGEFNQVEDERNRSYEGTGLGLAITRQLVGMMNGEIWVDSVMGEGSCFGFQLTLPPAEGPAPDPSALPGTLATALVIDDMPINRMILEKQLSVLGMRVTTQRSPSKALADTPGRFDVILVDNDIPELDGISFTRALRAAGINRPVVLLTSLARSLDDDQRRSLGLTVLQKPILRRDLVDRLNEIASSLAPPEPEPDLEPKRMRVLAAEDNRTNQLVLRKMVKALDLDLTFAGNGLEAVKAFRSMRPHLVFMDISMPQMDGKEATRRIRSIETEEGLPRTPICALTAHALDGDDEGILEAGLDFYLTKPLRKAEIFDRIARHVPDDVEIDFGDLAPPDT